MTRKRTPATSASVKTTDYRHTGEKRTNIPPAKIEAEGKVPSVPKVRYYYDPHLPPSLRFDPTGDADGLERLVAAAGQRPLAATEQKVVAEAIRHYEPWLEWAGKREQHEKGYFEVDPVALHIHERVSAQAIVRAAMREDVQRGLFADPQQTYHDAIQFYKYAVDWANRLILGDSLQVMSSLARRENLAGKVQMVYVDPPYGIKFGSNFQPDLRSREVGDAEDQLTREAETVRAYRDTWELGVHSYLSYIHQRLRAARELLTSSGSVFVQISEAHLHRIRAVLDDVFGSTNFIVMITIKKKSSTELGESVADYLLWYAKDKEYVQINPVYTDRGEPEESDKFRKIELPNGHRIQAALLNDEQRRGATKWYVRDDYPVVSQHPSATRSGSIDVEGRTVRPPRNSQWRYDPVAEMPRLEKAGRLRAGDTSAFGVVYWGDGTLGTISNLWTDLHGEANPLFAVQTNRKIVERCVLMTTIPGDLVLDPTCGSGTTAYVAEQWGRRWITIDTSRVALSIARQRLLTAAFPHYRTQESSDGVPDNPATGFVYDTAPVVTLKAVAKNDNLDPILATHEPILDSALAECNRALRLVTAEVRRKLTAKLKAQPKRQQTDADRRRWELPNQFEHWAVPFDTDSEWPHGLQEAVKQYRKAWRVKMDDVSKCIADNADQEELVDKPKIVKGVLRVSGPFTVEGVRPEELSLSDEGPFDATPNESEEDGARVHQRNINAYLTRMVLHLRADGVTFIGNKTRKLARFEPLFESQTGSIIHAEGIWDNGDLEGPNTVAVGFGPQYGPVTALQVEELIRAAKRYDEMVIAGFSFDAEATEVIQTQSHPRLLIHQAYTSTTRLRTRCAPPGQTRWPPGFSTRITMAGASASRRHSSRTRTRGRRSPRRWAVAPMPRYLTCSPAPSRCPSNQGSTSALP